MEDDRESVQETAEGNVASTAYPTLEPKRYLSRIAHMEIPDEQADELLTMIWSMMQACVGRSFGDNSIQRILPTIFGEFYESAGDAVQLENPRKETSTRKSGGGDELRH